MRSCGRANPADACRRRRTCPLTHAVTAYQVLARKYRPQTFATSSARTRWCRRCIRALDSGRVAHAFLFTGSRGVGKTTLARILARCLVCEKGVDADSRAACATLCKGVRGGQRSSTSSRSTAPRNNGVDAGARPARGRALPAAAGALQDLHHRRSAHAVDERVQRAAEDPRGAAAAREVRLRHHRAAQDPGDDPVALPALRLPPHPDEASSSSGCKTVLGAGERAHRTTRGLEIIARAAEGGMRDALSLTDQVLSFAGDGRQRRAGRPKPSASSIAAASSAAVEAVHRGRRQGARSPSSTTRTHAATTNGSCSAGIAEELRHLAVAPPTGSVRGFADLPDEDIARIDDRAKEIDGRDLDAPARARPRRHRPRRAAPKTRACSSSSRCSRCAAVRPLGDALAHLRGHRAPRGAREGQARAPAHDAARRRRARDRRSRRCEQRRPPRDDDDARPRRGRARRPRPSRRRFAATSALHATATTRAIPSISSSRRRARRTGTSATSPPARGQDHAARAPRRGRARSS